MKNLDDTAKEVIDIQPQLFRELSLIFEKPSESSSYAKSDEPPQENTTPEMLLANLNEAIAGGYRQHVILYQRKIASLGYAWVLDQGCVNEDKQYFPPAYQNIVNTPLERRAEMAEILMTQLSRAKRRLLCKGINEDGSKLCFNDGNTVLHSAAINYPKAISSFLKYGADINAVNNENETPLDMAFTYHCYDAVKILLKKNAKPARKIPVLFSAIENYPAAIRLLIKKKTRANQPFKSHEYCTPLLWAARQGKVDSVKVLLECDADPNYIPRNSESAIGYLASVKEPSDSQQKILELFMKVRKRSITLC